MLHKACEKRESYLRKLLEEERERNKVLQDQILIMAQQPLIVMEDQVAPAKVSYMDDDRMVELEGK